MLRYVRGAAALGVAAAISVIAIACGSEELFDESGQQICDDDCECMEPSHRCVAKRCACPVVGQVLCNRRGHSPANNEKGCYEFEQCEPGEMGIPEDPPPPEPECTEADVSRCPGPPDKECGSAVCIDGACGLQIITGEIDSQRAGDCKRRVCSSSGAVVEEEDPSDFYDDGLECTFDICNGGTSEPLEILKIVCPNTGEGYCSAGQCVQCVEDDDCKPGELCDYELCVQMTCQNGALDGDETDIDCGGPCAPCFVGDGCATGEDCRSGACADMTCQAPTCDDNVKNNGETDVDCGAACTGKPCGIDKGCWVGADCESAVCWGGKCQAATCTDGVMNAKEENIDCGGGCPNPC